MPRSSLPLVAGVEKRAAAAAPSAAGRSRPDIDEERMRVILVVARF